MIGHFTTNNTPKKKKKKREKEKDADRHFTMNEWNHDSRDGCKI